MRNKSPQANTGIHRAAVSRTIFLLACISSRLLSHLRVLVVSQIFALGPAQVPSAEVVVILVPYLQSLVCMCVWAEAGVHVCTCTHGCGSMCMT